jgi:hypothetical protein
MISHFINWHNVIIKCDTTLFLIKVVLIIKNLIVLNLIEISVFFLKSLILLLLFCGTDKTADRIIRVHSDMARVLI